MIIIGEGEEEDVEEVEEGEEDEDSNWNILQQTCKVYMLQLHFIKM